MLAAACALSLPMAASEELNYTVKIDYSTIHTDTVTHSSGQQFCEVSVDGLQNAAELNDPLLPVKIVIFEVPTYVNNFSVKLKSYSILGNMTLPLAIVPREEILTGDFENGNATDLILGNGYSTVQTTPAAEVIDEYFIDGTRHFVAIKVSPVLYNHSSKTLRLYNNLAVKLTYNDCSAANMAFTPIQSKGFQYVHEIDDTLIAAKSSRVTNRVQSSNQIKSDISQYVIITPESLKDALDKLVAWKKQKGFNVKVAVVEDILAMPEYSVGSNDKCFDEAASVREWMKKYYSDNGAFYCLIVGDYRTSSPIRKFYDWHVNPDTVTNPNHKGYVPTDIYFSDLVTDWNFVLTNAGIYSSDLNKSNYSPTVPVGRLLCHTETELKNFTDKLILYELYPGKGDSSYLTKGIKVMHNDAVRFKSNNLFEDMSGFEITDMISNGASDYSELRPTGQEILSTMNMTGIYTFSCHGTPDRLTTARIEPEVDHPQRALFALSEYCTDSWHYREDKIGLDELRNFNKPSIAYSIACDIAPFDKFDRMDSLEYNIVSAFTVAGKFGGPAFIANTREGTFTTSSLIEKHFGELLMDWASLGSIENKVRSTIYRSSDRFYRYEHNLIGDPNLKVWLYAPGTVDWSVKYSNGNIILPNSRIHDINIGIRGNDSNCIGRITPSDNSSISIIDNIQEMKNGLLTVYFEMPDCLPETLLIPIGNVISNNHESLFLRNLSLGNGISNSIFDFNKKLKLNIGTNSDMKFFLYGQFYSDNGLKVTNGGSVAIESENSVSLKNDSVNSEGNLIIVANELTLGKGFEVEKGCTFQFNNIK